MNRETEMSLEEINDCIADCNDSIRQTQMTLTNLKARLNRLTREREKRRPAKSKIKISDHAVLRYLQRVKGVDIDAVRKEILTPDILSAIQGGAVSITHSGVVLKINDGVIITVMEK